MSKEGVRPVSVMDGRRRLTLNQEKGVDMKTLLIIGGILLCIAVPMCGSYNGAVVADQDVQQKVGDVGAAYQRRVDLIPNLVRTVQASANFEKSTFTAIAEARARAGSIQLNATDLNDPAKLQAFQNAQDALGSSLGRLLAVSENYPQLHSSAEFQTLMDQLEGTENRIQTERHKLNDAIRNYNTKVLSFPGGFFVRAFGFQTKASFQAEAGAERAPTVDFGAGK
jgi:LemA protein